MAELNLMDKYPRSSRPVSQRAVQVREEDRAEASKFGKAYFDGDRLTGYGGYQYHPRFFTETVRRFIDHYGLNDSSRVLDVGCAKGFMIHDFLQALPGLDISGIDISEYAIEHAHPGVGDRLQVGNAKSLPYPDGHFDLVISINCIHSLPLEDCKTALKEIQRVSRKDAFIVLDAWHNEAERQALQQWNLTGLTFFHVDDWKKLFAELGYKGDYWWFTVGGPEG